jgi:predicted AlkP superfamily pyrophosphatase or phosphodiesterase
MLIAVVLTTFVPLKAAAQSQYVIEISADGLGSSYLSLLISDNKVPNIARIKNKGASTLNARADYDMTVTLPNHVTMVTGRGVSGSSGHNWTSNDDPAEGQTIHSNKGSYVAGVFDVAHDNGLRTAMYATKTKFSLSDESYNAVNGAEDTTGPDNGRDKIDTYLYDSSSLSITNSFISDMNSNPFSYAFLHYADGDTAGHEHRWGSDQYNDAIMAVDGYLGQILALVDNSPALGGRTTIIFTADHGGRRTDHSAADDPLNYTIPFIVWGASSAAGQDLYTLNTGCRLDPQAGRPAYDEDLQPVRNGDGANLALELLGFGAIPGSTINNLQDLVVPEPAAILLLTLGGLIFHKSRKA